MKIQKFMVEHIDGIRLKQGKIKECHNCGRKAESDKNQPSEQLKN